MESVRKIYYITRTWADKDNCRGCALLRVVYAEMLENVLPVTVVTPNYLTQEVQVIDNVVQIPYNAHNMRWDSRLERLHVKEDYLDTWVKDTVEYLKNYVTKNDIIFTVSGGELGCIKVGALLKQYVGCQFVINFHDPVDGMVFLGEKFGCYRGISRNATSKKYIAQADAMITSSETFRDVLRDMYPQKANKIRNYYLGYVNKLSVAKEPRISNKLNIVYAGTVTSIQNAEILYRALRGREDVQVTYICADALSLKEKMPEDNICCLPLMKNEQFLEYMQYKADVGFLSLTGNSSGACVPSKLYEYINIGIPTLASLPDGSAKDIIRKNGYGVACEDNNELELKQAIAEFKNSEKYIEFCANIIRDREKWFFENRKNEFVDVIMNLIEWG